MLVVVAGSSGLLLILSIFIRKMKLVRIREVFIEVLSVERGRVSRGLERFREGIDRCVIEKGFET